MSLNMLEDFVSPHCSIMQEKQKPAFQNLEISYLVAYERIPPNIKVENKDRDNHYFICEDTHSAAYETG